MSREVKLEELREKPDDLIAAIENGESVSITQGGRHVAPVNPVVRSVGGVPYPGRDFDFGPRPTNLDVDPAKVIGAECSNELADEAIRLLIEEREYERSGKKYER